MKRMPAVSALLALSPEQPGTWNDAVENDGGSIPIAKFRRRFVITLKGPVLAGRDVAGSPRLGPGQDPVRSRPAES